MRTAGHKPVTAEPVPGVANVMADVLSRKFQPGKDWRPPAGLEAAAEVVPPYPPLVRLAQGIRDGRGGAQHALAIS